jgi:hypothetical protein
VFARFKIHTEYRSVVGGKIACFGAGIRRHAGKRSGAGHVGPCYGRFVTDRAVKSDNLLEWRE